MSKSYRVAVGVLMWVLGVTSSTWSADHAANLMTYQGPGGERFFALSLTANDPLPKPAGRDLVVLVDTSASQTGAYRDDSLLALKTLATHLQPQDRIRVAAIDLKVVPMMDQFGGRTDVDGAIARLKQRAPLGATDLVKGLHEVATWFDREPSIARHVIYLGDGLSQADILSRTQITELAKHLVDQRATLTSYAIGPYRNMQILAALANQTGGQVFVDGSAVSGQQAGDALAQAVSEPVVWLDAAGLAQFGEERYPALLPPLRSDRDSIVIGRISSDIESQHSTIVLNGETNGQPVSFSWALNVRPSSDDFAFLAQLVPAASADGGASLATLSSAALEEVRRANVAEANQLTQLSSQALATGNVAGAQLLAEEAFARDPANAEAAAVKKAIEEKIQEKPANQVKATTETPSAAVSKQTLKPKDTVPTKKTAPAKASNKDQSLLSELFTTQFVQAEEPLRLLPEDEVVEDAAAEDAPLDDAAAEDATAEEAAADATEEDVLGDSDESESVEPTPAEGDAVMEESPATGDPAIVEPSTILPPAGDQLIMSGDSPSGLLDEAIETQRLNMEFIRNEVTRGLDEARRTVRVNPNATIVDLKSLREAVQQAPDVDADVRANLLARLETALRQANQQKVLKDQRDQAAREDQAVALEQQRILDLARRKDDLISTYVEQFNSRMNERRYDLAVEVADRAFEVDPNKVVTAAVVMKAQLATGHANIMALRAQRQQAVLDTLYQVERSLMPFPDDPPLVYPDAETWQNLTENRKKYDQVDFSTTNKAEERIMAELEDITSVEFVDEPLSSAIETLEQLHGIQIEVDQAALEEVGITTDAPVNKQLSGITLKSVLKLMLRDLQLTYIVDDEVLQITTPEKAEAETVTKVYPVADLVLPVTSMGGGMMGGMMGGMGMGGGMGGMGMGGGMGGMGMGGGMGGMGMGGMGMGGMGGGMGGMGMGGGFFAVDDKPVAPKAPAKPAPAAKTAPKRVKSAAANDASAKSAKPAETKKAEAIDWDQYFAQDPSEIKDDFVRKTLRDEMSAHHFDRVVGILHAGLRQGYVRPWIYEALTIAMQAQEAPADEIERALMSAVDLSAREEDLMLASVYLSRAGHDARALKVLQEVAEANPLRPEPYVQGLEIARRMKDAQGVRWATTNILRQAWPQDQRHIQADAVKTAEATLMELSKQDPAAAEEFRAALTKALARDAEVTVSWTGDADIDLLVEEPSGTVCSMRNLRTSSGGVLLGDAFSSDETKNGLVSETYVCPEGFDGQYRLLVRRVWGKVAGDKVTVDLYLHRHTDKEQHIRKQIPLSDKDAMVLFEVADGRRDEPLKNHQIATVVNTQTTINRAILAQQLNTVSESEAVTDLAIARSQLARGGNPFPFIRGGAVGYQPVITQLPEGTNLFATAVVSADRRYVRFSGLPLFSAIGEVQTFNFVTGQTTTQGGGTGTNGNTTNTTGQ